MINILCHPRIAQRGAEQLRSALGLVCLLVSGALRVCGRPLVSWSGQGDARGILQRRPASATPTFLSFLLEPSSDTAISRSPPRPSRYSKDTVPTSTPNEPQSSEGVPRSQATRAGAAAPQPPDPKAEPEGARPGEGIQSTQYDMTALSP
jgi:hypothetical protein